MKLKITIAGPKVHEVGYRYFLMSMAMSRRIRRFEAHNIEGEKEQEVEVLIDGDEAKVAAFKELARAKWPKQAVISNVSFDNYDDEVMDIGEYAQFCTTIQLNKAIPVLLGIRDNTCSLIKGQSETISAISSVDNKMDRMLDKQDQTISAISSVDNKMDRMIDGQDETVSEIRDLHEDLVRRDSGERLAGMEKDIRSIKSKVGLR